jgi:hypothetical protein
LAFWATLAASALLLYPLSFGPACWIGERNGIGTVGISVAYAPIIRGASVEGKPVTRVVLWYAALGASDRTEPYVKNGEVRWLTFPDKRR